MSGGAATAWVLAAALAGQTPAPLPSAEADEPQAAPLPTPDAAEQAPAPAQRPPPRRHRTRRIPPADGNAPAAPLPPSGADRAAPPETAPARRRPRKRNRRQAVPGSDARRRPRRTAGDKVRRAPRKRIVKKAPPRVEPWELNVHTRPMEWKRRAVLVAAQGGCAVLGAGAMVAVAGASALAARTADRPAGGLWRAPVPLGGLLPLGAGLAAGGVAAAACTAGLGMMAERRLAAPVAAMAAWSVVAAAAASVGLGAVLWPSVDSSRNFAIRENVMAGTLIGAALLGPVAALVAYQVAAVTQERAQQWLHQQDVEAAVEAAAADAAKPKAPPKPTAPPPVEPPPTPKPAPEPAEVPPEAIASDPLVDSPTNAPADVPSDGLP